MIYSKWGLKGITYHRAFKQKTVFEGGEQIEMVDEIANNKLLPVPWIRLESKMSGNLKLQSEIGKSKEEEMFHRTLFSLFPYQKITRRHYLIGAKRGYYPLETVSVTTGDAIGFGGSIRFI